MKIFRLILFILFLLSIASCSVQKRHYMSGYNIETASFSPKSPNVQTSPTILPPTESLCIQDTCDVMELKDSSKMRVKIIEIRATDVKYKICDIGTDSVLVTNKSEIIGIDFKNGLKGEFDSSGKLKPKKEQKLAVEKKKPERKINTKQYSKWSVILGVCAILMLLVAISLLFISVYLLEIAFLFIVLSAAASINGLIRAVVALRYIKKNPEDEASKKKAKLGLALNIIALFPILVGFITLAILVFGWFGIV